MPIYNAVLTEMMITFVGDVLCYVVDVVGINLISVIAE
jgi:hypothetical protein